MESSGPQLSENLRKFHAREMPMAQIRELFMSRKFHVLQYIKEFTDAVKFIICNIVFRLKSVGALEMFVAPMPEQIATTTMHFVEVPGELR